MRKDTQAVTPAISTVIITSVIVVLLMVTIVFANNFLDAQLAENEYGSSRQFMLTTGLQVDDVAWTMGRTQTIRYSSRYGQVKFEPLVLTYSFEVDCGSGFETVNYTTTGILLYNMPTSMITYGNNYNVRIFPSKADFLQNGTSAPVTNVFAVEKLPMNDGSYTRVVVAPSIRNLTSIVGGTTYVKFYLPSLGENSSLYRSQSITLTGSDVSKLTKKDVDKVRISVTFPRDSEGFDATFFNFESTSKTLDILASKSVVEFYIAKVIVAFGLHT